jgi:hypothetical protein
MLTPIVSAVHSLHVWLRSYHLVTTTCHSLAVSPSSPLRTYRNSSWLCHPEPSFSHPPPSFAPNMYSCHSLQTVLLLSLSPSSSID